MRKHWLLIALAVFSAVLAASALACSDDNNNDGGGGTGTPGEKTPAEGGAPGAEDEPVDVTTTDRAEAQIDISGDWIVTEDSLGTPSPCAAAVTQAGPGLSMVLEDCASLPGQQGTFSGTIDTATGDFSLSGTFTRGLALDLTGTASPDGNSISGSFTGPLPGTFDGVRQLAPSGEQEGAP